MAKVVLELERQPKENDILVYHDGKFKPVQSDVFYGNTLEKIKNLENDLSLCITKINDMQVEIKMLKGEE